MSKTCPKCGNTSPNYDYCYRDGHKLVDILKCSKCQTEVWPYASYCKKCGTKKGE